MQTDLAGARSRASISLSAQRSIDSLRSLISVDADGGGGGENAVLPLKSNSRPTTPAAAAAMEISTKGTPIMKISRPAKTPAAVIRNCFIGRSRA
jgi:hypothetical protein